MAPLAGGRLAGGRLAAEWHERFRDPVCSGSAACELDCTLATHQMRQLRGFRSDQMFHPPGRPSPSEVHVQVISSDNEEEACRAPGPDLPRAHDAMQPPAALRSKGGADSG
jgi:hypothetical protein